MQNKANFRNDKMNVSYCLTMTYEQLSINYENKNKPNLSLPKGEQSQFQMCPFKNGSSQEFLICAMSGLLIKSKLWLNTLYFWSCLVGVCS
jgi:hypothetical protein